MPERLTDARIEELLSLESKATQGEWIVSDDTCRVCREDGGEFNIDPVDGGMHGMFAGRDNPDFIAASRNSIRSLLEEVKQRRAVEVAREIRGFTDEDIADITEQERARAEKEGTNR